jgi:hypothetical protein
MQTNTEARAWANSLQFVGKLGGARQSDANRDIETVLSSGFGRPQTATYRITDGLNFENFSAFCDQRKA